MVSNFHCPRVVWAFLLGWFAVAPTASLLAQDTSRSAVVVSIASVDKLFSDIGYLTRAAGTPEVGRFVTLMAGQYVQGLDTKKPAGAFVDLAGGAPSVVAFLPVSDMGAIITKIEEQLGEPDDLGGGIRKVALQRDIFFRERGGWVFVSDAAANLEGLPQDPSTALGDLPSKYEIAVQLNVQNIPASLREKAISEMRGGFERGLSDALDGEDRDLQEQLGRRSVENLVSFIEDSQQLTVGWGVDDTAGATYIDVNVTARAGTKLAERFAMTAGGSTQFAGFLGSAATARLHFTSQMPPDDIEQAKMMLGLMRSKVNQEIDEDDDLPTEAARSQAKEIVGSLLDVMVQTVEEGKFDGGASLYLNGGSLQFVAGGRVSNGRDIETALKQIVQLAKSIEDDPNLERIEFNSASHRGVDLHTLSIPIPADEDEARRILGPELPVAVGTGAQAVYVAVGQGSRAILERVIDESALQRNAAAEPMTLDIAVRPILEFAASIEGQPIVKAMADALRDTPDHVSIKATGIPQGFSYRIEVQEGVLKLIGQAAKMQGGQGN